MIVVDGRADREKLVELMRQGEQTELEFKSTLDLKDRQKPDRLNFVKDVVALSNLPGRLPAHRRERRRDACWDGRRQSG